MTGDTSRHTFLLIRTLLHHFYRSDVVLSKITKLFNRFKSIKVQINSAIICLN